MSACPGGNAVKAAPVALHTRFQAQNTTPKATPSTAVTTMSTVRQRTIDADDDGRTACSAMIPPDSLRRHDPDQVRGSAVSRTLSAEALPCRFPVVPPTVALVRAAGARPLRRPARPGRA